MVGTRGRRGSAGRNRVERMQTTSLHLPSDLLNLLRMVAVTRASRRGGRPSVSNVVRELLESHRPQFEDETSRR